MNNIIVHTSSFEDLVKIVNSLTLKIDELEKKINLLEESNSVISAYNMCNEVILDETIFRNIPINAPPVIRQNAFCPMSI